MRKLAAHASESDRSWSIALLLSTLLGFAGADRFYLGSPWLGLLKLFTCGGAGVLWALDVVLLLANGMRDGEGRALSRRS